MRLPSKTGAGVGNIVREYDRQGWHRTGTVVDEASARWLACRARQLGGEPRLTPFPVTRIEPQTCALEFAGRRLPGLPLYDGGFTDSDGLRGRLAPLGGDGEIALARVWPAGPADEVEEARRSRRYRALVLVTTSGCPGLAPRNAERFSRPFGAPVLQVSSEAGPLLDEHAQAHSQARLVAHVRKVRGRAFNVVVRCPGQEPRLPPLVVLTPRSGWWCCASERGGGIACWLEALRAVGAQRPRRRVVFVATSGHELGFLGLRAFLRSERKLAERAFAWLHIGASIGAAQSPRMLLAASDDQLKDAGLAALAAEEAGPVALREEGALPQSEAGVIRERGGRYLSVTGGSLLFHSEADRWPEAVDVASLRRYARALTMLTIHLANQP